MSKQILITGASGLVGTRLTELLIQKGHRVSHLSRSAKEGNVPSFVWNVDKEYIDPNALNNIDTIIHLAGANVGEKRWSKKRKKEILESRTASTRLLFNQLKQNENEIKTFISASGISWYGLHLTDQLFTEEVSPAHDFLANVAVEWGAEADKLKSLGIRVVKIRTGLVLSKNDGALEQIVKPIKFYVGSPLGSGQQYMSWIHIDDLCKIYIKAVEDERMEGVFNGVAPHPVTNKEVTAIIAKILSRPLWLPAVPSFALRLALGEMANLVIYGSNVSSKKIEQAGYQFQFAQLEDALKDVLV